MNSSLFVLLEVVGISGLNDTGVEAVAHQMGAELCPCLHGVTPFDAVKDRLKVNEEFWNDVKANLEKVEDVDVWNNICNGEVSPQVENKTLTDMAADLLPKEPWTDETFNVWLGEVKAKSGLKGKDLFHPIRLALTGEASGPELKTLLPLIGYKKAYERLKGNKA